MLGTLFDFLAIATTIVAGVGGYILAKNFVRTRLRFVDAIRSPWAPFLAGLFAFVAGSLASILPFVTLTTAAAFGVGTGFGTARGARAIERGEVWTQRQLHP